MHTYSQNVRSWFSRKQSLKWKKIILYFRLIFSCRITPTLEHPVYNRNRGHTKLLFVCREKSYSSKEFLTSNLSQRGMRRSKKDGSWIVYFVAVIDKYEKLELNNYEQLKILSNPLPTMISSYWQLLYKYNSNDFPNNSSYISKAAIFQFFQYLMWIFQWWIIKIDSYCLHLSNFVEKESNYLVRLTSSYFQRKMMQMEQRIARICYLLR